MRALLVVSFAACSYAPRPAFVIDGPDIDGPDDGPPIDGRACERWSPPPHHFDPCAIPDPGGPLVLATPGLWTYDTDTGVLKDPAQATVSVQQAALAQTNGPMINVISTEQFSISTGAALVVTGALPIVIASWSTIDVAGQLDVSSSRVVNRTGAGANPSPCSANRPTAGSSTGDGGGGGGGGAFGKAGNNGGNGDAGGSPGGASGTPVDPPLVVRGGCAGAAGGETGGGSPGDGGGALQLTALTSITIAANGRLHASGAAGAGGVVNGGVDTGGGGGGSGGWLGFDAPQVMIQVNSLVATNGGGGGGGADGALGMAGTDGLLSIAAAGGGAAPNTGGSGGAGGATTMDAQVGNPGQGGDAGGGGGGGVGYVIVYGQFSGGGLISPAITTGP